MTSKLNIKVTTVKVGEEERKKRRDKILAAILGDNGK
jgi:hypothetical protein